MASRIIVRDEASSQFLNSNQIGHVLAPDLVHTLTITRPRDRARDADYFLVQASQEYLTTVGIESFAQALAKLPSAEGVILRLFLAGTANHHDSIHSYRQLVGLLRRLDPTRRVRSRRPEIPGIESTRSLARGYGSGPHFTAGLPQLPMECPASASKCRRLVITQPLGIPTRPSEYPQKTYQPLPTSRTPGLQARNIRSGSLSWRVG